MRRASILISLLATALGFTLAAQSAGASPASTLACNLRGSWVASTAETDRYLAAINPTATAIHATSGALSASFVRGTLTVGSLGLQLSGRNGATTIDQEIDIAAVAPYRVSGSRLALGKGTFKLVYIRSVIVTSRGITVPVRLPPQRVRTPPSSVAYSCTPRELRLRVAAGASGVTVTFRRDRG